jgi:hypothetical protein
MLLARTAVWSVASTVALALTLTGCGDDAGGAGPTRPSGSSAPAAATGAPAPASAPAPATEATSAPGGRPAPPPAGGFTGLEMAKSGGFAGINESVTVKADGAWTRLEDRKVVRTGKLTAAQLAGLRKLAADPALATEANQKAATARCADGFNYTLHVGYQLIRYEQCGTQAPPKVTMEIIDLVTKATT